MGCTRLLSVLALALVVGQSSGSLTIQYGNHTKGVPATDAFFGRPLFGANVTGRILLNEGANANGCSESDPSLWPSWATQGTEVFLLVDRGGCPFVQKAMRAEATMRAHPGLKIAALLVDDNANHRGGLAMADDGSGVDIILPCIFIHQADGALIKTNTPAAADASTAPATAFVQGTIDWPVPTVDDKPVEWELWTSSFDPRSLAFKKEFSVVANALAGRASFTPRYFVLPGAWFHCDERSGGGNPARCLRQCIQGGRYCAVDPDGNLRSGLDSEDLLVEDVRQLCLWDWISRNDTSGTPEQYWQYVIKFGERCEVSDDVFSPACSRNLMSHLGIDVNAVDACSAPQTSCLYPATGCSDSPLMERELTARGQEGIWVSPTLVVNGYQSRGTLHCPYPVVAETCGLLNAICAGFGDKTRRDGNLPAACSAEFWRNYRYPLQVGAPQSGTASVGRAQQYSLAVVDNDASPEDVEITVTVLSGSVKVTVTCEGSDAGGNGQGRTWVGRESVGSFDEIVINPEEMIKRGCFGDPIRLNVSVEVPAGSGDQIAAYTILGNRRGSLAWLELGEPQAGDVPTLEIDYFEVRTKYGKEAQAVSYTLSSKYTSHHGGAAFSDHLWVYKSDAVDGGVCQTGNCLASSAFFLSKADGTEVSGPYTVSQCNPADGTEPDTGRDLYYIAETAGHAFRGPSGYQYNVGDKLYFSRPTTGATLRLSATPQSGNVDLFVSDVPGVLPSLDPETGQVVNYTFSSVNRMYGDTVSIPNADPHVVYTVAVFGSPATAGSTMVQESPAHLNYEGRFLPMVFQHYGAVSRAQLQAVGGRGCDNSSDFASFVPGRVALIRRGTCTFAAKVEHAWSHGAAAVIIFNSGDCSRRRCTALFRGTLRSQHPLPVFSAEYSLGQELIIDMAAGPVLLSLSSDGSGRSSSDYVLTASVSGNGTSGTSVTLMDGVAQMDSVANNHYRYYKLVVTEDDTDVEVFVTPFSGHNIFGPDLFVNVVETSLLQEGRSESEYLPTRESGKHQLTTVGSRFHWGRNTLTIQKSDLKAAGCTVNATLMTTCTVVIGAYGGHKPGRARRHSSGFDYSIMAALDRSWHHPLDLSMGVPQAGHVDRDSYRYYAIRLPSPGEAGAVQVILTPMYCNPDLYVTIQPSAAAQRIQPSDSHYDFKSAFTGSGAEAITLRPSDPRYCGGDASSSSSAASGSAAGDSGCNMYIAVKGGACHWYDSGSTAFNVLVASSGSVTYLRSGDPQRGSTDAASAYSYYSVYVQDPEATVTVTLSSLSGRPVAVVKQVDPSIPLSEQLPVANTHSSASGSGSGSGTDIGPGAGRWGPSENTITIGPSTPGFCWECDLLIGVGSEAGATEFTVTVSVGHEVSVLTAGLPQSGTVRAGCTPETTQYYLLPVRSSTDTVSVTLTTATGNPNAFLKRFDGSRQPCDPGGGSDEGDPDCEPLPSPTLFDTGLTTSGSFDNVIVIPPSSGAVGSGLQYLVAVCSEDAAGSFTIVAGGSDLPITLAQGVSQRYTLASGSDGHFIMPIGDPSKAFTVQVTPFSGSVVLIGAIIGNNRTTALSEDPTSLACTSAAACSNYMFKAAEGADSLFFAGSSAGPCAGAVVSSDPSLQCRDDLWEQGASVLVAVFADPKGGDASFTITATSQDDHTGLVFGQPQAAIFHPSVLCQRSDGTGDCASGATQTPTTATYLQFGVANLTDNLQASLSVRPRCIAPGSDGTHWCSGTSSSLSLRVFVSACRAHLCTADQKYPSAISATAGEWQADGVLVFGDSQAVILVNEASDETGDRPCDGAGDCVFYVAMYATGPLTGQQQFVMTVSSPGSVQIVTPSLEPDALSVIVPSAPLTSASVQNYEIFVSRNLPLTLRMEPCSGEPTLLVCGKRCSSQLPADNEYEWLATSSEECVASSGGHAGGAGESPKTCSAHPLGVAVVTIPASNSNTPYFLSMKSTLASTYKLYASSGPQEHSLVAGAGGKLSATTNPTNATVSWSAVKVLDSSGSSKPVQSGVKYTVFARPESGAAAVGQTAEAAGDVLYTACGLDHARAIASSTVISASPTASGPATSATLVGLSPGVSYSINLKAECDQDCMDRASAKQSGLLLSSSGGGSSSVESGQSVAYSLSQVETPKTVVPPSAGGGGTNGAAAADGTGSAEPAGAATGSDSKEDLTALPFILTGAIVFVLAACLCLTIMFRTKVQVLEEKLHEQEMIAISVPQGMRTADSLMDGEDMSLRLDADASSGPDAGGYSGLLEDGEAGNTDSQTMEDSTAGKKAGKKAGKSGRNKTANKKKYSSLEQSGDVDEASAQAASSWTPATLPEAGGGDEEEGRL